MTRRLSREQRGVVAEKIMDWGDLVFTGLVIAQFVPGTDPFQWLFFPCRLAWDSGGIYLRNFTHENERG